MFPSMTFLLEAGAINEGDDLFAMIQDLDLEQAEAMADWLALATGGPVKLRFVMPPLTMQEICREPGDVPVPKIAPQLPGV